MPQSPNVFSSFISKDMQKQILYASGVVAVTGLGAYIAYKAYSSISKKNDASPSKATDANSKSAPKGEFAKCMDLKTKGNDFFRDKKYDEAVVCYTEAIQLCPASQKLDLATFFQNRAAAYEKLEQYENVINDCTEALKLNKKYTKAMRRRAESAEKLQHYQMAVLDYAKICISEDFNNMETVNAHDRVLTALGRQLTTEYLVKRGDKMVPLSVSFVNDSLSFYTTDPIINLIHSHGDGVVNGYANGEAQKLRGYERAKSCLIGKQYGEIIQACSEELEVNNSPFLVESLLLRGTFYIFCGACKKAADDLTRVLSLLNDIPNEDEFSTALKCNTYLKLAMMHQLSESFTECAECLNEAERINPNNPDIFLQRGTMFTAQNEFVEAREEYSKAVNLKPNCPFYNIQRITSELKVAVVNEDGMALRKCVEDFERLAERFPECAEAQSTYGIMLVEMQQQFLKATEYLEKALKLDPANATLLVRRGILDVQQQNTETGLKRIERALELDPYCLQALETLASYHATRSDVTKMLEFFDRALEVSRCKAELCQVMIMRETMLTQMKIAEDLIS